MTRITVLHPGFEGTGPTSSVLAPRYPIAMAGPGKGTDTGTDTDTHTDTPVVLTLIDNGKPKAREILATIAEELSRTHPRIRFVVEVHSKPSAAAPIDADTAQRLAARSRMVLTGVGD